MDDDALVQNVMERQWTRGRQWSTSRTETRTTVAADGIATISTVRGRTYVHLEASHVKRSEENRIVAAKAMLEALISIPVQALGFCQANLVQSQFCWHSHELGFRLLRPKGERFANMKPPIESNDGSGFRVLPGLTKVVHFVFSLDDVFHIPNTGDNEWTYR
ncbi:hypothetical protein AXG93_1175s1580 [Marchantia polymorpha subsp. ruderalis]|uniref:Uncharacterized protein n=1 Tax=Marchantia polymorpha subsp. ruderalis TaxID=1480154 RepID=A0A176VNE4_MARPO|nr:hypothetical protein AXG93_1175s1580 [Marchantia polymorpha subsp. ruderalis]